jgi:hypothetical protein
MTDRRAVLDVLNGANRRGPNGLSPEEEAQAVAIEAARRREEIRAAAAREARAMADAKRRAASFPPELRSITNDALPGSTTASAIDARGAGLETWANRAITGFDGYTPGQATKAVRRAEAEATERFAREHPARDFRMCALGDVAEARMTAGLGHLAGPLSGAVEGLQQAEAGNEIRRAAEGAAEAFVLDRLSARAARPWH